MLNNEEKSDWEVLCEKCSSAAKEAGLTKEDSKRILEDYRTMERKAIIYDELIYKLEEDISNDYHIKKPYGDKYCIYGVESISTKEYAQEILSIVKK